ncbi:molybdopterin-dependent oxidoreductase [Pseudactinotalea sp. HY160]|uniref:molybdopterin-dependent oxidoreductase n=1 Tax=Pseudactinotalea sp. HY160 TaxID=2654490 RepID=UPI00128C4BDD|nr:molybdopterin-dependent oxidoreductase [Pseudactinotalea sp. HY160]MPV49438.1 molybdopterin-dependent oxidoreductase [Pseudactinotalea sp. HY160]
MPIVPGDPGESSPWAGRRVPPGQRVRAEAPIMHYGPVPKPARRPWTFTVGGATRSGRERVLGLDEVLALPALERVADMHCATHWTVLDQHWSGVSAAAMVALAPAAEGVTSALVFAEFGYAANVPLEELASGEAILATHLDGVPLSLERGAPLRLVIPQLYTWKGPKWLRGWNYLRPGDPDLGFWEDHGYHRHGGVWREERYDYQR